MASFDLIDDSTGATVMVGLKKAMSLSARFSHRLSLVVRRQVRLMENGGDVSLYVSPLEGDAERKEKILGFLQELEKLLPQIHQHGQGPQCQQACDVLWDSMLCFVYPEIDHFIQSINRLFKDEARRYAELCERHVGVNDIDESGSQLDFDLGNEVIKLYHSTLEYDGSFKAANGLIQCAAKMVQTYEFLAERLVGLFQSQCGRILYEFVCELGSLQRAYDTFVRTAKNSTSFSRVTIQCGRDSDD